jgi:hypothetical protein
MTLLPNPTGQGQTPGPRAHSMRSYIVYSDSCGPASSCVDKPTNPARHLPRAGVALQVPIWATTVLRRNKTRQDLRTTCGFACRVTLLAACRPTPERLLRGDSTAQHMPGKVGFPYPHLSHTWFLDTVFSKFWTFSKRCELLYRCSRAKRIFCRRSECHSGQCESATLEVYSGYVLGNDKTAGNETGPF